MSALFCSDLPLQIRIHPRGRCSLEEWAPRRRGVQGFQDETALSLPEDGVGVRVQGYPCFSASLEKAFPLVFFFFFCHHLFNHVEQIHQAPGQIKPAQHTEKFVGASDNMSFGRLALIWLTFSQQTRLSVFLSGLRMGRERQRW